MKKKDEIAAELRAWGADFGGHEATDPIFHTPEGYFRDFPDQMTAIIKGMTAETSLSLPLPKEIPFEVPQGYFDQFCDQLLVHTRAMNAVTEQGHCAWSEIKCETPYNVPDGYFARFEEALFHKIFEEEKPVGEEIESLSPLLAGLKKEQPFAIPKGYFNSEAFAQQVQQPETRVVEHPSVRSIKWARWAAAAAVIAIFALGGLHYLVPSGTTADEPSFQRALAQIPEQNIREWLSINMDESDVNSLAGSISTNITNLPSSNLNGVSEKAIRDYLESEEIQ
jgi:hypothetical protein